MRTSQPSPTKEETHVGIDTENGTKNAKVIMNLFKSGPNVDSNSQVIASSKMSTAKRSGGSKNTEPSEF